MQRSHSENENVQFVQELAEVDGPFESPININFRDLTKLELPSLVWNRSDSFPKKMKITNTGHTVIISGKWKCERPYLTGGPLQGKYVFSQIHFHWGQDDCRGSEHQVCGESFPLEMHVAHFKTEYLTQECALREKDGMVVVVYLFKLQEEPNNGLKKILCSLANVKQPSTSHAIDPRPILSLCNPFTDDYFMYWGSVVTSTCAHILLWLVCREPFGISRDQVNEFRKLLDGSQQPICRNNRECQPLHKRNVFHVNASKHLDDPLLPVKKIMGCFCRGGEENADVKSNDCNCQSYMRNQEDIEGGNADRWTGSRFCDLIEGQGGTIENWRISLPRNLIDQSVFVQHATVHSTPLIPKRFDSDPTSFFCCSSPPNVSKSEGNSKTKLTSQSCCFFPVKETNKTKTKTRSEKRKSRERKRPFNSMKAFTHIMNSLEALKNTTFKKLKDIESINQEIKGIQTICQDKEDSRWLRKIEKIMARQKRFTIRTSQACIGELKKLAKECNFDKFFEAKPISEGVNDDNKKLEWLNNGEVTNQVCVREGEEVQEVQEVQEVKEVVQVKETPSKSLNIDKAVKFSTKAQKLIQSFFEDIKESQDLQETVKKNLQLKKMKSLSSRNGGDTASQSPAGFITQTMFTLGNLGDRFFTEVTNEDVEIKEKGWGDKEEDKEENEMVGVVVEAQSKVSLDREDSEPIIECINTEIEEIVSPLQSFNNEDIIPLHRANVAIRFSRTRRETFTTESVIMCGNGFFSDEDHEVPPIVMTESESTSESEKMLKVYKSKKPKKRSMKKSVESSMKREIDAFNCDNLIKKLNKKVLNDIQSSTSNVSLNSAETQRMIIAKIRRKESKKDIWKRGSSVFARISSRELYHKTSSKKQKLKNINLEGYYIKKKYLKKKKRKDHREENSKLGTSSGDASSTSVERHVSATKTKSKWKQLTKAKFKLEIEKPSDSTLESAIEYSLVSPERKKLKLESKRRKSGSPRRVFVNESNPGSLTESDLRMVDVPYPKSGSGKGKEIHEDTEESHHWIMSKGSVDREQKAIVRIHIPRSFTNDSRTVSRVSTKKSVRASSADSILTCSERPDLKRAKELSPQGRLEFVKRKSLKQSILAKNKSLTNLVDRSKSQSPEVTQRVFVENLNDRRKATREASEVRKKMELLKRKEESPRSRKEVSQVTSNEMYKTSNRDKEESKSEAKEEFGTQAISQQEYKVGFFTTTSSQIDEELLTNQPLVEKHRLKLLEGEKYQFTIKTQQENRPPPEEPAEERLEVLQSTDSKKSFTNDSPTMKGDADPLNDAELPTSASYPINSQSRPYSAETLNSSVKVRKRKGKKRPHCCKRSSRHYIRKNSSIFRKLNKVESRPLNFVGLTEEEQLKIISVNVAKYLKRKLVEHSQEFDPEKNCSFKELEEVVLKDLKDTEEKQRGIMQKEVCSTKTIEIKQEEITVLKIEENLTKKEEVRGAEEQKMEEIDLSEATDVPKPLTLSETASTAKNADSSKTIELPNKTVKTNELKAVDTPKVLDVPKAEKSPKAEEPKHPKGSPHEKRNSPSPRPVHNFIKLNKLMAGKYRRMTPPTEDSEDHPKKKEDQKPKPEPSKPERSEPKTKTPNRKRKEKSSVPKSAEAPKTKSPSPVANRKLPEKPSSAKSPKANRPKGPGTPKKPDSRGKAPKAPKSSAAESQSEQDPEVKTQDVPPEGPSEEPSPSLALQKIPASKKNWVPAYMLTSYLPAPLEVVETQQRKMNKYLLNMKPGNVESYLPEALYEAKDRNRKVIGNDSETLFKKDLEYLIKLQMCLNSEISANIENSMSYVRKLLTEDNDGSPIREKPPPDDPNNPGLVLTEMNNPMDCSTSSSDYAEDPSLFRLPMDFASKHKLIAKEISKINIPQDSGDSGIINPSLIRDFEGQEGYNSDSSYNCEISITLNAGANEGNGELQIYEPSTGQGEQSNHDLYTDFNNGQNATHLDDRTSSQSIVLRQQHRKKRKDKEISREMKQKLLEILEGEIRREMAVTYGPSSENSSEGAALSWEDSDMNGSHSTESNYDNADVMAQVSETMSQYLSDFKERRRESCRKKRKS